MSDGAFQQDFFKTAEEARDEAIARLDENHDLWIEKFAIPAIREALNRKGGFITTDDVWTVLGLVVPPEKRAMGAAMTRARRQRIIRPTSTYRKSKRPECHARPVRVWEDARAR